MEHGMKRFLLAVAAMAVAMAQGAIETAVSFSVDGGKSWCGDFPSVKAGRKFRVRTDFTISDTNDDRDVVTAELRCDRKFGSANIERHGVQVQRHAVYWKSSKVNSFYEWEVDTRGLGAGTHMMEVNIGYWGKGKHRKRHCGNQVIYVTVSE